MGVNIRKRLDLIIIAFIILAALLVFGMFFFRIVEHWSLVDSIYYTAMTITTVGYGDLVPTHDVSKIAASIFAFISIPLVLFSFGIIAESYFELRLAKLERRLQQMVAGEKEIEEILENRSDKSKID